MLEKKREYKLMYFSYAKYLADQPLSPNHFEVKNKRPDHGLGDKYKLWSQRNTGLYPQKQAWLCQHNVLNIWTSLSSSKEEAL